jgi:hypothetical protein
MRSPANTSSVGLPCSNTLYLETVEALKLIKFYQLNSLVHLIGFAFMAEDVGTIVPKSNIVENILFRIKCDEYCR